MRGSSGRGTVGGDSSANGSPGSYCPRRFIFLERGARCLRECKSIRSKGFFVCSSRTISTRRLTLIAASERVSAKGGSGTEEIAKRAITSFTWLVTRNHRGGLSRVRMLLTNHIVTIIVRRRKAIMSTLSLTAEPMWQIEFSMGDTFDSCLGKAA